MVHIDFKTLDAQYQGMQRISNEELAQTGKTNASFTFAKGDVIEFPPFDDIYAVNDAFKRKDGSEQTCIKVLIGLNGRQKMMPVGAIDRIPFGQIETWLIEHDLNREIHNAGNALERLRLLSGKVITVTEMVKGPRADFDASGNLKRDDAGNIITKSGLFPVFDWYRE